MKTKFLEDIEKDLRTFLFEIDFAERLNKQNIHKKIGKIIQRIDNYIKSSEEN